MKTNFSQTGSNQAAQWAQKKQDMMDKAAKIKAERKSALANTGERAISSKMGNNREIIQDSNIHQNQQNQYNDQQNDQYNDYNNDSDPNKYYNKPLNQQRMEMIPQNQSNNPNNNYRQQYNPNTQSSSNYQNNPNKQMYQQDYQDQYQLNQLQQSNETLQNKRNNPMKSQPLQNQQQQYKQQQVEPQLINNKSQNRPKAQQYDKYNDSQNYNQEDQYFQQNQYPQQNNNQHFNSYNQPVEKNYQQNQMIDEQQQYKASNTKINQQRQELNKQRQEQPNDQQRPLKQIQQPLQQSRREKPTNQTNKVQPKPNQDMYNDPMDERPLDKNINNSKNEIDDSRVPLVDCPKGCGRSFTQSALKVHAKICVKVFQKKRKEFNSQQHRIVDNEQAEHIKQLGRNDKKYQVKTKKKNWKNESLAFRAQIKASKGGVLTNEEKMASAQVSQSSLVQCKFCSRKFNESSALVHIPYCQKKAQDNQFKPKPPQKRR